MSSDDLRGRVLLSLQVALLGMITPNIYAVVVAWDEKEIKIRVVIDGFLSPEDRENISVLESEMMSHFPTHNVRCVAEARKPNKAFQQEGDEVAVFRRAD